MRGQEALRILRMKCLCLWHEMKVVRVKGCRDWLCTLSSFNSIGFIQRKQTFKHLISVVFNRGVKHLIPLLVYSNRCNMLNFGHYFLYFYLKTFLYCSNCIVITFKLQYSLMYIPVFLILKVHL